MKIYARLVIVLSAFFFASCEGWLDLKPETQATEEQAFSTVEGYRSVLNGLYKSMASASLYGRELTFGILDCMSQQYDLREETMKDQKYLDAGKFDYRSNYLHSSINEIWAKGFNVIANANNLIQNLEKCSPDFFGKGEVEKNMMLGEAYACRAMMHFDLVRLFAPAPVSKDNGAYVPYVETYPNIMADGIGVTEFMDKVIRDLEHARDLTIGLDTSAIGQCFMESPKSRFQNTLSTSMPAYNKAKEYDSFFMGRGYRLNYYAITALLARAYLYTERYDDALTAAQSVIDATAVQYNPVQMFSDASWMNMMFGIDLEKSTDLKLLSNLVFALYNEKAYDEFGLSRFFTKEAGSDNYYFVMKKSLFTSPAGMDESSQDYRYNYLKYMAKQQYALSGKYYCSNDVNVRNQNVTIVPMIRASEMQYIVVECYARKNDFAQIQNVLGIMKYWRGLSPAVSVDNWDDFEKELITDARREWIGEGQLFFLYKRLNADVDFGGNVKRPLTKAECVLPIPDDQSL
jgi:hypothetical protein